jgi:hypothetical protein
VSWNVGATTRHKTHSIELEVYNPLGRESRSIIEYRRRVGVDRIVEIGDGQVSDLVGWSVERLVEIWSEARRFF